jgi:hypothetical protein
MCAEICPSLTVTSMPCSTLLDHSIKVKQCYVWWALGWVTNCECESLIRSFDAFQGSEKNCLHKFSGPLPLLVQTRHQFPLHPTSLSPVLFKTKCYTYTETNQPKHLNPENGGSIYFWIADNMPTSPRWNNPRIESTSMSLSVLLMTHTMA